MRADVIAVLFLHMDLIRGKINIRLSPVYPIANESVTLSVTGITGRIWFFTWFKGPDASSQHQILTYVNSSPIPGAQHFSRVIAFPNGSLLIRDLQVEDRGNYTVKVQADRQEDANISLQVYETVSKPEIAASHTDIRENDLVSLTCVSAHAERIVWIKSGSEWINLENGSIVKHDNRTIIFSEIKRSDEGTYQCRAENVVSRRSSEVYTLIISGKENEPVIREPYGSSTSSQYITATSDSKHANFNESATYRSAGVTAGIISGASLGILMIFIVSFLLYKRRKLRRKKQMAAPSIHRPEQYAIYDNILDPATGLEVKEEPLYMCLQFSSEGTYNELHRCMEGQQITSVLSSI